MKEVIVAVLLGVAGAHASELVISELMARNNTIIADEDGDYSDWLEVYNPGTNAVNLAGWFLTDTTNDFNRWEFPAVQLAPGGFLLVFASNKDRSESDAELHTNFRLDGDGEYLGLVRPDGTICCEFTPGYPEQRDDISYGIDFDGVRLVRDGADVEIHVPSDDSLGNSWTSTSFMVDELSWQEGITGAGYGLSVATNGIRRQVYSGISGNSVSDLTNHASFPDNPSSENVITDFFEAPINIEDSYGQRLSALITPPVTGDYTFWISSDDASTLYLSTDANPANSIAIASVVNWTASREWTKEANQRSGSIPLVAGAQYFMEALMKEQGGGDNLAVRWEMPGGQMEEPIPVSRLTYPDEAPLVTGTDMEPLMRGLNSSVYLRIPFQGVESNQLDSLTLRIRYNDGFVAYLNGYEVVRRNAPQGVLTWNSSAAQIRSKEETEAVETINITPFIDVLNSDLNVLAVHGLNASADSDDFLIQPEIIGGGITVGDQLFFHTPSPGEVNSGGVTFGRVADTKFSLDRGFYTNAIQVEISTKTDNAEIRYTLDCSWPTSTSGLVYNGPILIDRTTVLRAMAHKPGFEPTDVDTQTYIFLEDVIRQPALPVGFEAYTNWGGVPANYEMDPDVVNDPGFAETIIEDMKSIPIMSLALPKEHLFGGSGIYSNPNSSGVSWERAGSIEMFYPDGTSAFSVNCGVRIHGGVGRNREFYKHNFRLLFKGQYGPTKLRYPLFGEEATDRFDTIILRAGFNNTWHRGNGSEENRAQYLRDEWMHRTQLAMGQASSHGSFCHLYVDGLYWGVYNHVERPSAPFCASYYGGDKEEWDVLNSSSPVDGNKTTWNEARNIANAGVADQAGYDALAWHVDIPNLIDYMLFNFYGGNQDWDGHNWYAGKRRMDGEGWKFFSWDAERSLESTTGNNRTGLGSDDKPSGFYAALRANPEFRMQFADRAHRHMYNGGALSVEECRTRYLELANFIDRAIVGESARWGDTKRATPYTRDAEWVTERDRLLNSYFPQRTSVLKGFLRGADLYPQVDAPVFNQGGGVVPSEFPFYMNAPSGGIVYYTVDGTDPRLPDGSINTNALAFEGTTLNVTLISRGSDWHYLDNGSDQGIAWRELGFDDSTWASGPAQLGYGDNDENTVVSYGVDANNKHITTYFRHAWNITDPSRYTGLSLKLLRDDGAVVYLNGNEVFRSNMPGGEVNYLTAAMNGSAQESTFLDGELDVSLLVAGTNVVAVEMHQDDGQSSDISFDLELLASGPGSDPLTLDQSALVKARAWNGSEWSALNEALFVLDEPSPLRVTEIMFHSSIPEGSEIGSGFTAGDFDFLELQNVSTNTLGLAGVEFSEGIRFNFAAGNVLNLRPAECVVVVKNLDAFALRYTNWTEIPIAGEYEGSLDNNGEEITLSVPQLSYDLSIEYGDNRNWPLSTDGAGHSLVPLLVEDQADNRLEYGLNWRASSYRGGSPGFIDPAPIRDVVINEVAAHTDYPGPIHDSNDWIELYNLTPSPVSLGDWYLSDSPNDLRKWAIPDTNTLDAQDWISFDEVTGFHAPVTNGFGLNKSGEKLYLSYLPGNHEDRVADAVEFKGQEAGVTLGRYSDGESYWYATVPTRNAANILSSPMIVISELMYHPLPTTTHPEDNSNDEYIILYNSTGNEVALFNEAGSWRLAGEVAMVLPANLSLGSDDYFCLVSFDPSDASAKGAFLDTYGLDESMVQLVGPYWGKLSNRGGRIALERPQAGDLPGDPVSWVIVDEVYDFDRNPFSYATDATGLSLHRVDTTFTGRSPGNWIAGLPSPADAVLAVPEEELQIEVASPTSRHLSWDPLPGMDYTVEYADSPTSNAWQTLGTVNTNGRAMLLDQTGRAIRFYRLRRLE